MIDFFVILVTLFFSVMVLFTSSNLLLAISTFQKQGTKEFYHRLLILGLLLSPLDL